MDILVPRYKVVTLSGQTMMNGQRVAFRDTRNSETGKIHRQYVPVNEKQPLFILPGVGEVDEGEMREINAYLEAEGNNIMRRMREKNGRRNLTSEEYNEAIHRIAEQRLDVAKGKGVSGPHYTKEVLG